MRHDVRAGNPVASPANPVLEASNEGALGYDALGVFTATPTQFTGVSLQDLLLR